MFPKNCWYCAGWEFDLSQSADALLAREIAGEPIVLYRTPAGDIVAMEDRCCHRQAPLSLGTKEGDAIRCGYHGLKFAPDGTCIEIPGQQHIPPTARVRTFPVTVKDSWMWVWIGEKDADNSLICDAVGPDNPDWNICTSQTEIHTNYRLEIANLMDLSHVTWVHRATLGGTNAWVEQPRKHTISDHGVTTEFWMPASPVPTYFQHLFPPEIKFDAHLVVEMTMPCNFLLHAQFWSLGTAQNGKEKGQLLLDTFSSQAVTPRNHDWVDYYYSWGVHNSMCTPGLSEMFLEALDVGFAEDKRILEGQHRNVKAKPDGNLLDIKADEGPNKFLWLLDKKLKEQNGMASIADKESTSEPDKLIETS